MSILIVEDNATSAMMMQLMLKKGGYKTQLAGNGQEALERLGQDAAIQLIVTDVMMPVMDGLTMLREVKASPQLRKIPVIITTAAADAPSVKEAAALGCKHYLVKPVNKDELLSRIATLIRTEKAVVKSRADLMVDLGLDPISCTRMIDGFRDTLTDQASLLRPRARASNSEPNVQPDLAGMLETAQLFGAERLQAAVENLSEDDASTGEAPAQDYSPLLREINLVLETLPEDRR